MEKYLVHKTRLNNYDLLTWLFVSLWQRSMWHAIRVGHQTLFCRKRLGFSSFSVKLVDQENLLQVSSQASRPLHKREPSWRVNNSRDKLRQPTAAGKIIFLCRGMRKRYWITCWFVDWTAEYSRQEVWWFCKKVKTVWTDDSFFFKFKTGFIKHYYLCLVKGVLMQKLWNWCECF